jgi:hypothetical protein
VSLRTQLCRQNGLRLSRLTTLEYGGRLPSAALRGPLSGKKLEQSIKFLVEIDGC